MRTAFAFAITAGLAGPALVAGAREGTGVWRDEVMAFRDPGAVVPTGPRLELVRQDFEALELGQSVLRTPLRIGSRTFARGLGTHSISRIRVTSEEPMIAFSAWVGVDHNERTTGGAGAVTFTVTGDTRGLYRSEAARGGEEAQRVDVRSDGMRELDLEVGDGGDGPACDHADWAEAQITTKSGRQYWLDDLARAARDRARPPFPFSFTYAGRPVAELLSGWKHETTGAAPHADRSRETVRWTDPDTGLQVTYEVTRYTDFPAAEWLLYLENTGNSDTGIIQDVNVCDLLLDSPLSTSVPYRLHRTNGGVPTPAQFAACNVTVDRAHPQRLTAGTGHSSAVDFPFFKIDTGRGSAIVAVGWSGCWAAEVSCPDGRALRLTAGLARTHFRLRPGERVRMPRMLALFWEGESWDANARFRELIYKHYAAKRDNRPVLPLLFCNTCFTRGGGWLNECNAANQIALINAYAPLGLEALLTDAGWFRGGWPHGAGNWTPREDAYPEGMGPVAAAARARGMIYGLWFEPERVVAHTDLHKAHLEWLLRRQEGDDDTYLLNLGLPAAREHFFNIVKGYMDLPGFRFYRQDFTIDPLPYWRFSDAPDRQGVTEMKYIEGLYAYWDRLAAVWPDGVREECAGGGHRIDLETIMRMHVHQKTDYWFDDDTDQAALWGVSQYLPNSTVVAHLNRLDDYSFHSTLASSLCLGWIADAPDFDHARAKKLAERYFAVRHLLIGAWYPLLPYSRGRTDWSGAQYHRADLDEGLVLVFRRAESPYPAVDAPLRGLQPNTRYEVVSDSTGLLGTFTGAELAREFRITLPKKHSSDLITYRAR